MSLITYAEVRPWAQGDRAAGRQRRDAAVARGCAARHVPERARPDAGAEGRRSRDGRPRVRPKADPADLPAAPTFAAGWRIGTAGCDLRDAGGLLRSRARARSSTSTSTSRRTSPRRSGCRRSRRVRAIARSSTTCSSTTRRRPTVRARRPCCSRIARTAGCHRARRARQPAAARREVASRLLATYAPGTNPQVFPAGTALRLPPGGVLHLQMHYTANGTAGTDRTKVGMIFAKEPPEQEIRVAQFLNGRLHDSGRRVQSRGEHRRRLRAGRDAVGTLPAHPRSREAVELHAGTARRLDASRSCRCRATTSTGRRTTCSRSRSQFPKGARIRSTAWYDNSAANRSNPDPTIDVKWGDQTWEEMQYTGIMYSESKSRSKSKCEVGVLEPSTLNLTTFAAGP